MATTTSTTTTYALPTYIYKILSAPPPIPIPAALPLSELDAKDGFIHLSTASQVPTTASLFFAPNSALWLLKVDTRKTLAAGGVYQWVKGMPGCPHLYAPDSEDGDAQPRWVDLGSANVVKVREVKRAEGQAWEDALENLKEEGWLVDE